MGWLSNRSCLAFVVAAGGVAGGIPPAASGGGTPDIDWYSINNGSARTSDGGGYQLRGSIGQPAIGLSGAGAYELRAGFWHLRDMDCGDADDGIFCNGFED